MSRLMHVGAIIGVVLSFFYIFSLDGFYRGFAIFLTHNLTWSHLLIYIPLLLLFYLSRLATTLLPDVHKIVVYFTAALFAFILEATLLTGAIAGNYFQRNPLLTGNFRAHLAGIATLPYAPLLYLGSPLLVGIFFYHAPLIVAGAIALCTGHPATAVVERHVARKRPSAVITQELSQALRRHDTPAERIPALLRELPPWRGWLWEIRARRYAAKNLRLHNIQDAERSAQQTGVGVIYGSLKIELHRQLQHLDLEPLITSEITPERIRAIAEEIIADDIKAKSFQLTPDDLEYHTNLREEAEEMAAAAILQRAT